jgi:hypothetical protein
MDKHRSARLLHRKACGTGGMLYKNI